MKIKKFTLVEDAMYVVIKGSENLCKTQVLCAAATQPLTLTLSPKGREDKKKISSPIGEGAICHPELGSGSYEMLKHGGQSDVQHDITNYPLAQFLPRVKEAEELSSRFTLNPSLKRTYSHINLFTYSPYKKTAFTLAEVLITLGIIGVVAAMTLPVLISNKRAKDLEIALKKNASVIQQAILRINLDNGYEISPLNLAGRELKGKLIPYMNVIKDCGFGTEFNSCVPSTFSVEDADATYKTYNKTSDITTSVMDDGQFILSDGSMIILENNHYLFDGRYRVYISVDVNGFQRKPNAWGHDLFTFEIDDNGKLIPMGAEGTYFDDKNRYCSKNSSNLENGIGCTYYALTDPNYFKNLP